MSILYKGPSIDASYQVSVHLAKGFQGRLMPSDGKSSHCLWQGQLKRKPIKTKQWISFL
jgi:hypothetical protein